MTESIIILLLLYLIWIAFECLEGLFQGHYYDLIPIDKGHPNIHWVYGIFRALMLISLSWIYYFYSPGALFVVFGASLFFAAPFFHNGMLYVTRHKLNSGIYARKWFDNKEKTVNEKGAANIEISIGFRITMFVISIVFVFGLILEIIYQ